VRYSNIPANLPSIPQLLLEAGENALHLFPICPEKFFKEIRAPVTTRTTPPPLLAKAEQEEFKKKSMDLAPEYRTQLLKEA